MKVRVKVRSFINEAIHDVDEIIEVAELDDRVELIEEAPEDEAPAPVKEPAGKGKKKAPEKPGDFLEGE